MSIHCLWIKCTWKESIETYVEVEVVEKKLEKQEGL